MSDKIISSWINIYIDKVGEMLVRAAQGNEDGFQRKVNVAAVLGPILHHYNAAGKAALAFDLVDELSLFEDENLQSSFRETQRDYALTKFLQILRDQGVNDALATLEDVPYADKPAALLLIKKMGYALNEQQLEIIFSKLESQLTKKGMPSGVLLGVYRAYNLTERYFNVLDLIDGSLTLADLFILIRAQQHSSEISQKFLIHAYKLITSEKREATELPIGVPSQQAKLSRLFILSLEIEAVDFAKTIFAEIKSRFPGTLSDSLGKLLSRQEHAHELIGDLAVAETIDRKERFGRTTLLDYFYHIDAFKILCRYASGAALAQIVARTSQKEKDSWRHIPNAIVDSLIDANRHNEILALGVSLDNNSFPIPDLNVKPLISSIAFHLMDRELFDLCLRFTESTKDAGLQLLILSLLHRRALGSGVLDIARKAAELYLEILENHPEKIESSRLFTMVHMTFLTGKNWAEYYARIRKEVDTEKDPEELITCLFSLTATAALVGNDVDFVDASEQLLAKISDDAVYSIGDDGKRATEYACELAYNLNYLVGIEKAMNRRQELRRLLQ